VALSLHPVKAATRETRRGQRAEEATDVSPQTAGDAGKPSTTANIWEQSDR
jgi:hypothetical protein